MLEPCPSVIVLKCTERSSAPVHTPVVRSGVMPINHPSLWFCVVPVLPAIGFLKPYLYLNLTPVPSYTTPFINSIIL